jgi:hypothetical protein
MTAFRGRARINPALAKKQADQKVIQRLARTAEATDRARVQNGAHGAALRALEAFLRGMSLQDGKRLVAFVEASPLRAADAQARRLATRIVGDRIRALKAREGLDDSDPLPGQPESAGQAVRRLLRDGPP